MSNPRYPKGKRSSGAGPHGRKKTSAVTTLATTRQRASTTAAGYQRPEMTIALCALVCERMAEGQSLRSVCCAADMPAKSSFMLFLSENALAAEMYARAIEARMPAFLDTVSESRRRLIRADNDPRLIAALRRAGFRIRKATKGPGSIESGLRFLQGKDIVIHPDCTVAADEFANHSWKRDKITGKPIVGEPEEARNHTIDAARYATEDLINQVRFRILSPDSAAARRSGEAERAAEMRARISRLAAQPIASE